MLADIVSSIILAGVGMFLWILCFSYLGEAQSSVRFTDGLDKSRGVKAKEYLISLLCGLMGFLSWVYIYWYWS